MCSRGTVHHTPKVGALLLGTGLLGAQFSVGGVLVRVLGDLGPSPDSARNLLGDHGQNLPLSGPQFPVYKKGR